MFRIGEFAQIAQVSGRQLRYYDQLGLLAPARIDPETGYRYYSVRQLPRLNRILALKDLGLTLDQIGPLLEGAISPDELRAMLALRRAEAAGAMREAEVRLRQIESRIDLIDHGAPQGDDVVVKSADAAPYLSLRGRFENMERAVAAVSAVAEAGTRQIRPGLRDRLTVLSHADPDHDGLTLEIGFTLTRPSNVRVSVAGGEMLRAGELPAVARMATMVRHGPPYESHQVFGAVGAWIEANGCEVAGPCREVFLEPIGPPDVLVEIQFPLNGAA